MTEQNYMELAKFFSDIRIRPARKDVISYHDVAVIFAPEAAHWLDAVRERFGVRVGKLTVQYIQSGGPVMCSRLRDVLSIGNQQQFDGAWVRCSIRPRIPRDSGADVAFWPEIHPAGPHASVEVA